MSDNDFVEVELRNRIAKLENVLRLTQSTLAWCQGFISVMKDGQGRPMGDRKNVRDAMEVIDRVLAAETEHPTTLPEWATSEEAFDKFWKTGEPFPDERPV